MTSLISALVKQATASCEAIRVSESTSLHTTDTSPALKTLYLLVSMIDETSSEDEVLVGIEELSRISSQRFLWFEIRNHSLINLSQFDLMNEYENAELKRLKMIISSRSKSSSFATQLFDFVTLPLKKAS